MKLIKLCLARYAVNWSNFFVPFMMVNIIKFVTQMQIYSLFTRLSWNSIKFALISAYFTCHILLFIVASIMYNEKNWSQKVSSLFLDLKLVKGFYCFLRQTALFCFEAPRLISNWRHKTTQWVSSTFLLLYFFFIKYSESSSFQNFNQYFNFFNLITSLTSSLPMH
jgi:hypothetical protein